MQTYADVLMANAAEPEFFSHARMKRETFEAVLKIVSPHYREEHLGGRVPMSCRDALLISLKYLGSGAPLKEIAAQFGVRAATVYTCTSKVIEVLTSYGGDYVKWPSSEDLPTFEKEFQTIAHFPGVLGVLGGCRVNFKAVKSIQADYLNDDQHCVHLLAICDANKKFLYVDAGFPGAAPDSQVFESTSFFSALREEPCHYFPSPNFHVIGDDVYQMDKHVLVPYDDAGTLLPQNGRFNTKLRKTRVRIEQTFALLKARFQRLRFVCAKVDRIKKLIVACCVLHNIVMNDLQEENSLLMEGSVEKIHASGISDVTNDINISVELSEFVLPADIGALEKRDFIASLT